MSELSILNTVDAPWVVRATGAFGKLRASIESSVASDVQVVALDGNLMRNSDEFYSEIAKKLKLPDYFGKNLNALDECITDLEWLDANRPFVIIIRDSEFMLMNESELREGFIDVLASAGEEWASEVCDGNDWDRPAVPFHVILNFGNFDETKEGEVVSSLPSLNVAC